MTDTANGDARHTGTVKWFNQNKGFGFIQSEGFAKDVFLHINEVERSKIDPDDIQEGDKVSFIVKEGKKGAVAAEIRHV